MELSVVIVASNVGSTGEVLDTISVSLDLSARFAGGGGDGEGTESVFVFVLGHSEKFREARGTRKTNDLWLFSESVNFYRWSEKKTSYRERGRQRPCTGATFSYNQWVWSESVY